MNPDTMTLTELREWHARDNGWKYETGPIWQWRKYNEQGELVSSLSPVSDDHPYPPTLDGAASAMPKGWEWQRKRGYPTPQGSPLFWEAFIWQPKYRVVESNDTGDEITDRYRLAMKAKLAEKESPDGN